MDNKKEKNRRKFWSVDEKIAIIRNLDSPFSFGLIFLLK